MGTYVKKDEWEWPEESEIPNVEKGEARGDSGASKIGIEPIVGLVSTNVQDALEELLLRSYLPCYQ